MSLSCTMWCDRLIPDIWCCDSHRHISYLTLTYIHLIFGLLYLTHVPNTGTCHAYHLILILVLAMLYLLFDIWPRYLPCLSLDIWYCYLPCLLLDIWHWYLPCYTYRLIPDTWYCGTCIIMHIHDYYFYGNLAWLLYCYQIFGTPELLYSCIPELLKKGDSWYYTPDIIPLLIPVVG